MARWRPTPPDEAVAEAEVFIGQLRFADAARVLLGALFHAPDHAGVLRQLGICCLSCGQPADAMGYFARAERAAPDDPETAYRIGLALLTMFGVSAFMLLAREVTEPDFGSQLFATLLSALTLLTTLCVAGWSG